MIPHEDRQKIVALVEAYGEAERDVVYAQERHTHTRLREDEADRDKAKAALLRALGIEVGKGA